MLNSLGSHRFRGDHRSFPRLAQFFRSLDKIADGEAAA
jgi:hypothetical protein